MAEEKKASEKRLSADELSKAAGGDWDTDYKKGDIIEHDCHSCGCNRFVCVGGMDARSDDPFTAEVWFECCACRAELTLEPHDRGFLD